ncbi:unnamed protein product [Aspergillus oryzae]|uniref:Unnamed protein product n=1 Tax=Aspergillus oryzae TaxID=5062 RepID=A0AAN4YEG6_ASPOZ|nr:unnamed protein product [Aspergillus oryzae]GMF93302.1 unnamed protein product [Aspergillus oryzae]GMG05619.1 unnamed protein product [Aspergillus oryzae]GMG28136.1 unnamed protein product [Aspergillus oryzae]
MGHSQHIVGLRGTGRDRRSPDRVNRDAECIKGLDEVTDALGDGEGSTARIVSKRGELVYPNPIHKYINHEYIEENHNETPQGQGKSSRVTNILLLDGAEGNFGPWGILDWICGTTVGGDEDEEELEEALSEKEMIDEQIRRAIEESTRKRRDERVDAADVDAGAGGDHIAGVDTTKGNTVDLEGAGDEEDTLVKVLEEDNTLATEATGEEDQDSTGLEAFPELGGTNSLADLFEKKNNHVRTLVLIFP